MPAPTHDAPLVGWRRRAHEIIFEADTPAGRLFDIALLVAIVASIVVVCLESVAPIAEQHGELLRRIEWGLTIAFTAEYLMRLACIGRPRRYAFSLFGLVDLLAILPTYLSLIFVGTQSLVVIRSLRLLRVFRVLKLGQFVGEATQLRAALSASARKITIFLFTVLTVVTIIGAAMYLVEGEASGFTSIPRSMYWAIVTMTTVGYGDVTPDTPLGQALAAVIMVLGYGILAVPTGIVSVELARMSHGEPISTQACPGCSAEGHDTDARYCKRCGAEL